MSLFCYECQIDRPQKEMSTYNCVCCGGRKCNIHGGGPDVNHVCKTCGYGDLCLDCILFKSCCMTYDPDTNVFTYVGRVAVLQNEIKSLRVSNKKLRDKINAMRKPVVKQDETIRAC